MVVAGVLDLHIGIEVDEIRCLVGAGDDELEDDGVVLRDLVCVLVCFTL